MHFTAVAASFSLLGTALAASLQRVTNFGSNPGGMNMYLYKPDKTATNPAVLVANHPCGGNGQQYFSSTNLKTYSDQYGFILIYPEAPHDSNCFDVASNATQTHNGGSDSLSIVQMVNYVISTYSADRSRVFVTGQSSGGMMTNILMGAYPDVFAAAAPNSAFPYGCLVGGSSSPGGANPACASGRITKTGAEWAAIVRNGYPSYTGSYPRVSLWHGTNDQVVSYVCFGEEIKEWSTILNVTWTRNVTNSPSQGYTEMIYGDGTKMRAYSQSGGVHFTPLNEPTILSFFGLLGGTTTTSGPTSTTTTTTTSSSSSSTGGCTVPKWGQCGGQGYTGCTTCAAGSTCQYSNAWYSQCL